MIGWRSAWRWCWDLVSRSGKRRWPPARKWIDHIVIGLVHSRHCRPDDEGFGHEEPEPLWCDLPDHMFLVAGETRVIDWRDDRGKLCYFGPPRFWERLVPGSIVRGPRVPEDYDAMVAELQRDDDWSQAVLEAAHPLGLAVIRQSSGSPGRRPAELGDSPPCPQGCAPGLSDCDSSGLKIQGRCDLVRRAGQRA